MIFTKLSEGEDKWYRHFWLSESKLFAIGLSEELFGRLKIQVLYRWPTPEEKWWVIQEYVTYKPELVLQMILVICQALDEVSDSVLSDQFEHWNRVAVKLPKREHKYLEGDEETI